MINNSSSKTAIETIFAPAPIGIYSQAIKTNNLIYISGQLGKIPDTDQLIRDNFVAELEQIFKNIASIGKVYNADLDKIIKLTIFMTDLSRFPLVNDCMSKLFSAPYPARSTVQVSALPLGANIEIEAIMTLS